VTNSKRPRRCSISARGIAFFPLAVGNVGQEKPVLAAIAAEHGAPPSQIALAWLLARSPVILPIPGTSSLVRLEENWDARRIALSPQEMVVIGKQG
jgi:pyridoxine 4-dehydrogenase